MHNSIIDAASGFATSRILMAANNLGIFDELAKGAKDAQSISQALKLNKQNTEMLCNALAAFDILKKESGKFYFDETLSCRYPYGKQFAYKHWIKFQESMLGFWGNLEETIVNGSNYNKHLFFDKVLPDDGTRTCFAYAMHEKAVDGARHISQLLPLGGYKNALDLGGGIGTYILEWCSIFKDMSGAIYDFPPMLIIAKQFIELYELTERVSTIPGDFLSDSLYGNYDLIILANVLHMLAPNECQALLKKIYNILQKNGRLIIHGYIPNQDGSGPVEAALFAFLVPYLTSKGESHNNIIIKSWLEETGFAEVNILQINSRPSTVITGVKK